MLHVLNFAEILLLDSIAITHHGNVSCTETSSTKKHVRFQKAVNQPLWAWVHTGKNSISQSWANWIHFCKVALSVLVRATQVKVPSREGPVPYPHLQVYAAKVPSSEEKFR